MLVVGSLAPAIPIPGIVLVAATILAAAQVFVIVVVDGSSSTSGGGGGSSSASGGAGAPSSALPASRPTIPYSLEAKAYELGAKSAIAHACMRSYKTRLITQRNSLARNCANTNDAAVRGQMQVSSKYVRKCVVYFFMFQFSMFYRVSTLFWCFKFRFSLIFLYIFCAIF